MKKYLIVLAVAIVCSLAQSVNIETRGVNRAAGMKDICRLRPRTGRCKANLQRWFYSPAERRCKPFVYGGCDGNNNNFLSVGECNFTCAVDRPMFCFMEAEYGLCNGRVRRWFFNRKTRQCEIFLSSGCKANRNYFISRAVCEKTCKAT
ncbi:tissue factor pathway inhibitor-like isoform X2 [Apostichopus japonicus]|uniref:tissue factor pathway inhibitor-like isoform X2 n=1 Tax=Stichopus japonicus TaxID=307972 RepID=UPI003AB20006